MKIKSLSPQLDSLLKGLLLAVLLASARSQLRLHAVLNTYTIIHQNSEHN